MMQRMYPRLKQALAPRRLLDYGVFIVALVVLGWSFESLGSLVRPWSHLDGWSLNVLTWALELVFVLAAAEIWRRIDHRVFGPRPCSAEIDVGISLFSGLGDQKRYWAIVVAVGGALAAGSLTHSIAVFFVTAVVIMGVIYTASFFLEQSRARNGVPG
jgi:hypothetical protein